MTKVRGLRRVIVQKQNGHLERKQEEFQVLLKKFEQVKAELTEAREKLEKNVEEGDEDLEEMKKLLEEHTVDSSDKMTALELRLKRVGDVYERTLLLDEIKLDLLRLPKAEREAVCEVVGSLKKVI
jgi:nitrate/nitrite-specific signal transduction histidine kinase